MSETLEERLKALLVKHARDDDRDVDVFLAEYVYNEISHLCNWDSPEVNMWIEKLKDDQCQTEY